MTRRARRYELRLQQSLCAPPAVLLRGRLGLAEELVRNTQADRRRRPEMTACESIERRKFDKFLERAHCEQSLLNPPKKRTVMPYVAGSPKTLPHLRPGGKPKASSRTAIPGCSTALE